MFLSKISTVGLLKNLCKMTARTAMESIKANAELTKQTIQTLKDEIKTLNEAYTSIRSQQLLEENAQLTIAVEEAKKCLINLEIKNGKKQVPVPNQQIILSTPIKDTPTPVKSANLVDNQTAKTKEKKEKKVKEPIGKPEAAPEPPVDVGRLDLRIAKVVDVQKHPDADSLYVLQINCGEEKPRTVCSGLVKHVTIEELRDRFVVLLCNLKPVKMRGITSQAMVMCASTPETVEVLSPPEGCAPGDLVHVDGYTRQPDPIMNPKKKIFETVAPDLHTNEALQVCYKGVPFSVLGKGIIRTKSLKNSPVK